MSVGVFHAYANSDIRSLSKLAVDGPHSSSERDIKISKITRRLEGLSESAQTFGVYGWCVAICALLYSTRLLRRNQLLEDKNATLEADLEEKKMAEQVAASDPSPSATSQSDRAKDRFW